jgi:hypothetical protein
VVFFDPGYLDKINLLLKARRINPNRPNTTNPILAALGSPARTELMDHAMENSTRKAPIIVVIQAFQLKLYFLFRLIIPIIASVVKTPMKKNIISTPENIYANMISAF